MDVAPGRARRPALPESPPGEARSPDERCPSGSGRGSSLSTPARATGGVTGARAPVPWPVKPRPAIVRVLGARPWPRSGRRDGAARDGRRAARPAPRRGSGDSAGVLAGCVGCRSRRAAPPPQVRSQAERPGREQPAMEGVLVRWSSPSLTRRRASRAQRSEAMGMRQRCRIRRGPCGKDVRGRVAGPAGGRTHRRREVQREGASDRGSTRIALHRTRGRGSGERGFGLDRRADGPRDGCGAGQSWRFAVKRSSTWSAHPKADDRLPCPSPPGPGPRVSQRTGRDASQDGARRGAQPGIEQSPGCS